jgi:hypothetical protein
MTEMEKFKTKQVKRKIDNMIEKIDINFLAKPNVLHILETLMSSANSFSVF